MTRAVEVARGAAAVLLLLFLALFPLYLAGHLIAYAIRGLS